MDKNEIWEQLQRVTRSKLFSRATKPREFLKFVVKETLEDRVEGLDSYSIAEKLWKKKDFDAGIDGDVRSAAYGAREKLAEYYQTEGASDPWIIDIRKGGFIPTFTHKAEEEPAAPDTVEPRPPMIASVIDSKIAEEEVQPSVIERVQAPSSPTAPKTTVGHWRLVFISLGIAIVGLALLYFFHLNPTESKKQTEFRIKIESHGGIVGPSADVNVAGWYPGINHYLIVEPKSRDSTQRTYERWIQFKIDHPDVTGTAQFGQADTSSGANFLVYVLSTRSELPEGRLKIPLEAPIESQAITVALQK